MSAGMSLSVSRLLLLATCLRKYYFAKVLRLVPEPQMPLELGKAIHTFIAHWVHRKTKDGRAHFYLTEKSAVSAWKGYWWRYWSDNKTKLEPLANAQAAKACEDGAICIRNYMRLSMDRSGPLHIEYRVSMLIEELGVKLVGVIDQIRVANPRWLEKRGKVPGGTVLVDLKSGKPKYWWDHPSASDLAQARTQTSLRNNIQATAYCMLYKNRSGRVPEAFCFWMLGGRTGRIFATERSGEDFRGLIDTIRMYVELLRDKFNKEDFPKTPNTGICGWCGYWRHCHGSSEVKISAPITSVSSVDERLEAETVPLGVGTEEMRQLRFKLKGTRGRRK